LRATRPAAAGTDSLVGTSYLDTSARLCRYRHADRGNGNDTLDGGLGIDTAVYSGAKSDYTLAKVGGSYTITDSVVGRDGSDTLTGIEKLQFSDQTFILSRVAHDYNGDGKSDTMWR
jgi:Ca2+-binding RTX toxin-like protein